MTYLSRENRERRNRNSFVFPSGIELMLACDWPFPNRSNSLGFWTGSGRSRIALSSVKMAVLAPMPSVRERMAIKVKPGVEDVFPSMQVLCGL